MYMEYDAINDIWIATAPLPMHIKAFIRVAGDAVVAIINDNLSDDEKRRALLHEVAHHKRMDLFRKDDDVAALEDSALNNEQKRG